MDIKKESAVAKKPAAKSGASSNTANASHPVSANSNAAKGAAANAAKGAKAANAQKVPAAAPVPKGEGRLLAVLRVRGLTGMAPKQKYTLKMLNLNRSNNATLVKENVSYMGMLKECKDYITWGPISRDVLVKMLVKRARIGSKKLGETLKNEEIIKMADELIGGKTIKEAGINKYVRLAPPSGGWKNKKKRFPYGDLGPRESLDELLRRMI